VHDWGKNRGKNRDTSHIFGKNRDTSHIFYQSEENQEENQGHLPYFIMALSTGTEGVCGVCQREKIGTLPIYSTNPAMEKIGTLPIYSTNPARQRGQILNIASLWEKIGTLPIYSTNPRKTRDTSHISSWLSPQEQRAYAEFASEKK